MAINQQNCCTMLLNLTISENKWVTGFKEIRSFVLWFITFGHHHPHTSVARSGHELGEPVYSSGSGDFVVH